MASRNTTRRNAERALKYAEIDSDATTTDLYKGILKQQVDVGFPPPGEDSTWDDIAEVFSEDYGPQIFMTVSLIAANLMTSGVAGTAVGVLSKYLSSHLPAAIVAAAGASYQAMSNAFTSATKAVKETGAGPKVEEAVRASVEKQGAAAISMSASELPLKAQGIVFPSASLIFPKEIRDQMLNIRSNEVVSRTFLDGLQLSIQDPDLKNASERARLLALKEKIDLDLALDRLQSTPEKHSRRSDANYRKLLDQELPNWREWFLPTRFPMLNRREDTIAIALNALLGFEVYNTDWFDPVTGKFTDSPSALQRLLDEARTQGTSPQKIAILERRIAAITGLPSTVGDAAILHKLWRSAVERGEPIAATEPLRQQWEAAQKKEINAGIKQRQAAEDAFQAFCAEARTNPKSAQLEARAAEAERGGRTPPAVISALRAQAAQARDKEAECLGPSPQDIQIYGAEGIPRNEIVAYKTWLKTLPPGTTFTPCKYPGCEGGAYDAFHAYQDRLLCSVIRSNPANPKSAQLEARAAEAEKRGNTPAEVIRALRVQAAQARDKETKCFTSFTSFGDSPPPLSIAQGFFSQALTLALVTSPAWVPMFALPWWQKRKKR